MNVVKEEHWQKMRKTINRLNDNIDEAPVRLVCPKSRFARSMVRGKFTVLTVDMVVERVEKYKNKPYLFFLWEIEKKKVFSFKS